MVAFEGDEAAARYAAETELPWPVLVDRDRELYRAYGMARGSWRDIWNLATLRAYAGLLARGQRLRKSGSDVRQLGGDVLIGPDGCVHLCHVSAEPTDRPAVSELIAAVREG